MHHKLPRLTILMILAFTALALAQDLEYYRPVGFQNPLLKSGQYILSTYFSNENKETEHRMVIYETNRYSLATSGYLGITDKMTLSTNLNLFPRQTTNQYHGEGIGKNYENVNLQTEVTLSYRPRKNLEFWGTAYYTSRNTNYGEHTVWLEILVGRDPDTGAAIYEEKAIIAQGSAPYKSTNTYFSVGFTLTGDVW